MLIKLASLNRYSQACFSHGHRGKRENKITSRERRSVGRDRELRDSPSRGFSKGNTVLTDFAKKVLQKHNHKPAADITQKETSRYKSPQEQHLLLIELNHYLQKSEKLGSVISYI